MKTGGLEGLALLGTLVPLIILGLRAIIVVWSDRGVGGSAMTHDFPEKDLFQEGFDAGLQAIVRLLEDPSLVERHGVKEAIRGCKDRYDTCCHGRYRDEPCFDCLRISIEDVVRRRYPAVLPDRNQ